MVTLIQVLAIAYGTLCIVLFFAQSHFIFFPDRTVYSTPAAVGLPHEEIWLPVPPSQERLHGWWLPHPRPLATLLYLHGNGGNISTEVNQKATRLYQLGFSVLLVDYRGYGRSQGGFPSEARVYEDAETAWNYLIHDRRLSPQKIVLYGHSLGGAIALDLAVKHPQAAGLIVSSSFTSMPEMAARDWKFRLFPIPLILTQKFDSLRKVRSLQVPVLFIHGEADSLVPATMAEALYHQAPPPKQLLLIPHAGHNHTEPEFNTPENLGILQNFVKRVVAAQSRDLSPPPEATNQPQLE